MGNEMVVPLSKTAKNVEMKSEEDVPFPKRFLEMDSGLYNCDVV